MAARNKRVKRTHERASRHRDELLQEARSLMADGRVREARAVEARANQVDQLVGALGSDLLAESQPERSEGNPDNRSAAEGIPRSASGATRE
jgi:hypothetical protein